MFNPPELHLACIIANVVKHGIDLMTLDIFHAYCLVHLPRGTCLLTIECIPALLNDRALVGVQLDVVAVVTGHDHVLDAAASVGACAASLRNASILLREVQVGQTVCDVSISLEEKVAARAWIVVSGYLMPWEEQPDIQ